MKGIDNQYVVDALCNACTCMAFAPAVAYTVGVNTVVLTQSTTFDSGDSLKRLRVDITDKNGVTNSYQSSGAGSGATFGTVTFSAGAVTGVPVTGGGTGYTVPPRILLTGGGGTGAHAIAVVNSSGVITSITIVNGGTGYTSAPTASVVVTDTEVSLAGLDRSKVTIQAFLLSTGGCKADLSVHDIKLTLADTGSLGNINEQGDNNAAGNN